MSKNKKSNKPVDPIIRLALENKAKSLTASDDSNNQRIIKQTNRHSEQNSADRMFKDMKKLPYQE